MNFDDEFFCGCCESCDSFEESKGESTESELELEECRKPLTLWEKILQESEEQMKFYLAWKKENNDEVKSVDSSHPSDSVEYLNREIFPVLLPALEQMLLEAKNKNVIENQKSQFNGQDYLAEILWNKNSRHPARSSNWLTILKIPEFQSWLKSNPRPIFPKSWLWSEEEAASIIQKCVRSWLAKKHGKF